MPSYRGVDQSVVAQSIVDILELLKKNSSGSVLDSRLKDISVDKILSAQNDLELAQAVSDSGIKGRLCRISELLTFHAVKNTDGKGYEIFKTLASWDAFSGIRRLSYGDMDKEADAYIKKHSSLSFRFKKAKLILSEVKTLRKEMLADYDYKGMRGVFNKAAEHVYDGVLFVDSLLSDHLPRLPVSYAMDRYGVVVPGLSEMKVRITDPSVIELSDKTELVLKPFYDLDEVGSTGIGHIGSIYKKNDQFGVVFDSTRAAAEAVAAAFPQHQVIDSKGNVIKPSGSAKQNLDKKPGMA